MPYLTLKTGVRLSSTKLNGCIIQRIMPPTSLDFKFYFHPSTKFPRQADRRTDWQMNMVRHLPPGFKSCQLTSERIARCLGKTCKAFSGSVLAALVRGLSQTAWSSRTQ